MVAEIDGARKGREVSTFLKTFEGAAATFEQADGNWSLWLPEMSAGDWPITPASQLYFAVILRRDDQAFAIRFFYDCSTGKIRYYTSAVPQEIAQAPEFENAVSALFRHSLPVEPIRQRKLRGLGRRRLEKVETPRAEAPRPAREVPTRLADPVAKAANARPAVLPTKVEPVQAKSLPAPVTLPAVPSEQAPRSAVAKNPTSPVWTSIESTTLPAPAPLALQTREVPAARPAAFPREASDFDRIQRVEFDVGARMRSVLMSVVYACGIVATIGILAYSYLVLTEDPGVKHHRLQNEALRGQASR
jgi:hypothetical protein